MLPTPHRAAAAAMLRDPPLRAHPLASDIDVFQYRFNPRSTRIEETTEEQRKGAKQTARKAAVEAAAERKREMQRKFRRIPSYFAKIEKGTNPIMYSR